MPNGPKFILPAGREMTASRAGNGHFSQYLVRSVITDDARLVVLFEVELPEVTRVRDALQFEEAR